MKEPRWNGRCHRCGQDSQAHTMSMYSTALICMDCCDKERKRPDYKKANDADIAAIRAGNFNFPGIGEPS